MKRNQLYWMISHNIQINNEGSIPAAGHFIGLLERVLMLSFILLGEYGGVGFLLAAKSIFRFGDLFLVQHEGLPIGGPASGTLLEVFLYKFEHYFDAL